jgi:hypothetical protein
MKLRQLLEELTLELNVPQPKDAYKFDKIASKNLGYGDYYKYAYTNINEDPMEVTVLVSKKPKDPGITLYVAFGADTTAQGTKSDFIPDPGDENPNDEDKYDEKTGAGDTLKVLATVVQAVKNTAEKVGGMDKVYAMAWAPSDKKRDTIYDYYVETLFPTFEKNKEASKHSFKYYINKDFKGKKVNEIGLEKEKIDSYVFKTEEDMEDYRLYSFKTPSGLLYAVELEEYDPVEGPMEVSKLILYGDELDSSIPDDQKRRLESTVLIVTFGVIDESDDTNSVGSNQNIVTNKGELYRVMNTVTAIVKEDLAINQYIKYIAFNPAKRTTTNPKSTKVRDTDLSSNSRANLYTKYILGRLPNAEIIPNNMFDVLAKVK